jgi:hypothetical protein
MPIIVASAASRSQNSRKYAAKKIQNKYLHLKIEKEKLEHELTTKYPLNHDLKFKKILELLMMNG